MLNDEMNHSFAFAFHEDRKVRQVMCHICCAEFGTTSLKIHQDTCQKRHEWGVDLVEHEEGIPSKEAALNRKKCTEPGPGTLLPLPTVTCKAKDFDEYNEDVLAIFTAHSAECLYCRERNHRAIENAHRAAQLANDLHHADEEEENHHRQGEEARVRLEERRLRHALEEAETHARVETEDEAHRAAEEEAARRHDEEEAALEAASLQRENETKKTKSAQEEEEEEDRRNMRILRQEREAKRRAEAASAARDRKKAALSPRAFLRKHDGVLAATQAAACFKDRKDDERAMDDIEHMSIAHARQEHLIHPHHLVGGATFHEAHLSSHDMEDEEGCLVLDRK